MRKVVLVLQLLSLYALELSLHPFQIGVVAAGAHALQGRDASIFFQGLVNRLLLVDFEFVLCLRGLLNLLKNLFAMLDVEFFRGIGLLLALAGRLKRPPIVDP